MSQPNFQTMSRKELHAYVLAHREDREAFYAYVDKLHTEASWIEMPPLQSLDDLKNYPEFLEKFSNDSEL
ncbi:hypothetical protein I8752_12060 [Nostocaceae cyanobacterium CENA369]|uniref:Uncharacterized protein n=1 Tax=Dendronalium phyllosphericum CENA369 TaxID=1725256 RepID=A0A8J7I565_9NOST|nr:hypothetical protein [Dendronalium phyllosphericum]MBH8573740.1 hypothetical protein [Dendronalium phyllosphericum CENA369]